MVKSGILSTKCLSPQMGLKLFLVWMVAPLRPSVSACPSFPFPTVHCLTLSLFLPVLWLAVLITTVSEVLCFLKILHTHVDYSLDSWEICCGCRWLAANYECSFGNCPSFFKIKFVLFPCGMVHFVELTLPLFLNLCGLFILRFLSLRLILFSLFQVVLELDFSPILLSSLFSISCVQFW